MDHGSPVLDVVLMVQYFTVGSTVLYCFRGDRAVLPDWNEAGKTKIPDLSVGKGCPYYFPTPFCQDLHPVRRSDCHKKPDDVLP